MKGAFGWILFCSILFVSGCGSQEPKPGSAEEQVVNGPDVFEDISGSWSGSWHDPKQHTSEAFDMKLSSNGFEIFGQAVFHDANKTKADIQGAFEEGELQLTMIPHSTSPYDVLPKTTWTGKLEAGVLTGHWNVEGKGAPGYAESGPWTSKRNRGEPSGTQ
ncbi:hypothetical protein P3T73_09680 [Kiritimatiellota bacterium B12222]|nr:hypothetical protein P3T73_09680 [Kiritimatiellota bacterium B12222]